MQELKDAIARYGKGIDQDIVKVDMFLNHRIETGLLFRMGEELANRFREDQPDLVYSPRRRPPWCRARMWSRPRCIPSPTSGKT